MDDLAETPGANLRIDHVVILVDDLSAAVADYESLGFAVVPGGEHSDGVTHNALVSFEDGSYLELIAFKRPPPRGRMFDYAYGLGEGFIAYALAPSDIEQTLSGARSRGLEIEGPIPGGRVRPDGVEIAWQTVRASTRDLPFLCADVTPRERRVPSGTAWQHPNGVTGIAEITVAVSGLEVSKTRYAALLGQEPDDEARVPTLQEITARFRVGETEIMLVQPTLGPARERLEQRGEGVYALSLRTSVDHPTAELDPARTHSARFNPVYDPAR